MSDSVRPHRRQPTRLPRPWDSPGKNTGVGCHFLLQCMKVKVKSLSRVRLFVTPWTAAYQAPPSMGFSRQEYWSGVPSPSLNPGFWSCPSFSLSRYRKWGAGGVRHSGIVLEWREKELVSLVVSGEESHGWRRGWERMMQSFVPFEFVLMWIYYRFQKKWRKMKKQRCTPLPRWAG